MSRLVATDDAGNRNFASRDTINGQVTVFVDTSVPTVQITSSVAAASLNPLFPVVFTFSKSLASPFTSEDIMVTVLGIDSGTPGRRLLQAVNKTNPNRLVDSQGLSFLVSNVTGGPLVYKSFITVIEDNAVITFAVGIRGGLVDRSLHALSLPHELSHIEPKMFVYP